MPVYVDIYGSAGVCASDIGAMKGFDLHAIVVPHGAKNSKAIIFQCDT